MSQRPSPPGRWLALGLLAALLVATGCSTHSAVPGRKPPVVAGPVASPSQPPTHKSRRLRRPHAAVPAINLIGQSQTKIVALLGTPLTRAIVGPSQVWTYHGRYCTVTLTFFLDVTHNEYNVLSRDVTGTDGSEMRNQQCLRQIVSHAKSS